MKQLNFAIVAAGALALLPAPAVAQYTAHGTDFVEAVKNSDGNKANELLTTQPNGLIDSRDGDGNTGLIIAIARRDEEWTGFLLNKGADPNLAGKGGNTPLIVAARSGLETGVEWLLRLGARVDATNRSGETALIVAVQQRATPIVKLLLEAGANPDKADAAQGYSARQYAARDPRARDILTLIQSATKKPAAKPQTVDDFKLK